ncbi:hypothetical protein GCK32_020068 [Trichostrongylus colubriformis]|uniref:Uncharacterized protein n=1 Tax=Trichostrongylus colubriformis TaxID=6319 RepID=A0AAN8EQY3_TRICO
MKWRFIVITMLFYIGVVLCRRKTSAAERAFENREGLDWARPDDDDKSEQKQPALEVDAKSTTDSMSSDLTASTLDRSSASTDAVTPQMQTLETSSEAKEANSTSTKPSSTTSTTAEPQTDETVTDDLITALLGSFDILNLTQKVEEEFESSLDDALNRYLHYMLGATVICFS